MPGFVKPLEKSVLPTETPRAQDAKVRYVVGALGLMLALAACSADNPAPAAKSCVHSHNDYLRARPLFGALEAGACSVEADVFLVDGALRVAHVEADVASAPTLDELYLAPLEVLAREGTIQGRSTPLLLLVDVKSEPEATFAALTQALEARSSMLTRFRAGKEEPGAVTVVLSGKVARVPITAATDRWAAVDGMINDLGSEHPVTLVPQVSIDWLTELTWAGGAEIMPPAERTKLEDFVHRAHAQGRRLRFWNTADSEDVWAELMEAGVDLIGTNDVQRTADFVGQAAR